MVDGVSKPSELHSLASPGVSVLHLAYKESKRTDANGNQFKYRAKVDDAKGLKGRALGVGRVSRPSCAGSLKQVAVCSETQTPADSW